LQTDLHEKHESLNENLNLPVLSQLQFGPSLIRCHLRMYPSSSKPTHTATA